jgi:hypothetical protein
MAALLHFYMELRPRQSFTFSRTNQVQRSRWASRSALILRAPRVMARVDRIDDCEVR